MARNWFIKGATDASFFSQDSGRNSFGIEPTVGRVAGGVIQISLPSETDDEMALWRDAGKQHLLDAFADEDAVYDEL